MKRNIVVSKSNNTKRNAKYRAKKGNKTKKDSSSSEENKELPVGAELLIAASVPAMLVGTLVAGIGLLSTESALAGSNGNGNIVATPVSTPTKTLELVAQVADEEVVSADFDLKQMLIDASKPAPATESSEAKEKVARDKKQKAADAKAAKAKKKADAKAAAAAKKLELAKKKVEARKQLPKPNHEKAKDRAQRAREVTQAKIDAEKKAKAKIRAAMQVKVEAKTKSQSSSIGESETEKDKIAQVNAQLRKKPEMAKPKAEPEADKMPAAPAAPTTAAVEK